MSLISFQIDPNATGFEYPVGWLLKSTVNINPATFLGYGTWAYFGTGRVIVGVDTEQTEFDTVEKTGGSKTHILTTAEMPSHSHSYVEPSASGNSRTGGSNTSGVSSGTTGTAGSNNAHNNLQPYITAYFWKRTL